MHTWDDDKMVYSWTNSVRGVLENSDYKYSWNLDFEIYFKESQAAANTNRIGLVNANLNYGISTRGADIALDEGIAV